MTTEPRARLGEKLAAITPGDIDTFFFTNGGAESNENAIKIARQFTGRHKILARYRSYHTAPPPAASRSPAIPAAGQPSRAWPAWSISSIPTTVSSAVGNPPPAPSPPPRKSSNWKAPTPSPPSLLSRSPAPTAFSSRHPSVGATRSIGLFGIVELIRDRKLRTPMAPFNGISEEMQALGRFFRAEGLYTFIRWDTFFTCPPLIINETQLREAFCIIDRALDLTDKAVV